MPKPYIGKSGEVRELDGAFFARARRGRPPMAEGDRKVRQNFMIDRDIAARLEEVENKRAFVNEALRKALGES